MRKMIDPALANGSPCILATVSAEGEPDIGYKGSMMIFDNASPLPIGNERAVST